MAFVSLVPGVLRAVEEGLIGISSVHNFCPLPVGVDRAAPNLFQPSSRKRAEAVAWLRHSLKTLELAKRVDSPVVVLHAGSVAFRFRDPARLLERGREAGETDAVEVAQDAARDAALQRLRRRARVAMRTVRDRLFLLGRHAEEAGVALAVENREDVLELPMDEGFAEMFEAFPLPSPLRYWHDTGHAEIKRRLGLLDPDAHLRQLADRLCGFHLHDVDAAGADHREPGTGSVDFEVIRQHLRPHHVVVLEPSPRLESRQISRSRDFLI